jgi:predicted deacylase
MITSMSQHRLWKIFDKLNSNRSIPREIPSSVYSIMTDFTRSKITEEEAIAKLKNKMMLIRASANHYYTLLSALEEEE